MVFLRVCVTKQEVLLSDIFIIGVNVHTGFKTIQKATNNFLNSS